MIRSVQYIPPDADLPHQVDCLAKLAHKRRGAIFLPPGTGKTRVVYRNVAMLFNASKIDGLLIVAPNEVHTQWINEQLPKHLDPTIKTRVVCWDHKVSTRKAAKELVDKPLPNTLAILSINYEAITTKDGIRVCGAFLKRYTSFFVLDESHRIKTPAALTTRRIQILALHAYVKRILTGTPSTQSPFDLYSQFRFLDERILGFDSFQTFKAHYGIFATEHTQVRDKKGNLVVRTYETLQDYARLDELSERIAPYSFRRTKAQCHNLPPAEYMKRPVALSTNQRKLYNHIKQETITLLEKGKHATLAKFPDDIEQLALRVIDPRERIMLKIKLTQSLRLQQVLGGFITDDGKVTRPIDKLCPRIEATQELIAQCEGKIIVWAQFRAELAALQACIPNAVSYHGLIDKKTRGENLAMFKDQKNPARVLIAHPQSAGTGLDLWMVDTEIYYSNGWSVVQRLQSEDRAHRIGRVGKLSIFDMCATEVPLDETIRETHKTGVSLAEKVLKATMSDFMRMV